MQNPASLDPVFHAIGNPTCRAILTNLADRERSTGAIAKDFPLSHPTISKHLEVLKVAGLVTRRHEGRNQLYTLDAEPLAAAHGWLLHYKRFWRLSLTSLKRHLEDEE